MRGWGRTARRDSWPATWPTCRPSGNRAWAARRSPVNAASRSSRAPRGGRPRSRATRPMCSASERRRARPRSLYYTADHPTLGPWEGSNPTYGGTIADGRRGADRRHAHRALRRPQRHSARSATATAPATRRWQRRVGTDGEHYCYDPTNSDKGQHAYPYRYQMWAYDLNELAEVRAGRRDPWSVKPYGVWPFELPIAEPGVRIGGVAYDAGRPAPVRRAAARRS